MATAGVEPVSFTPDRKHSPLRLIFAGSLAGAVEAAVTYPFEFAKTRVQLNRSLPSAQKLGWPPFPSREWYAGCTTLMVGNSLKAGIRFVVYDAYKSLLSDRNGRISGPGAILAGFGAGFTESLLAVTPFESIKTQLIDDRKRAQPRMKGLIHGSIVIAREKGLAGFFQGLVPTTARQAANSATRFGTYGTLRQLVEGRYPGQKPSSITTFGIGGIAGVVTVYVTMPLDTIKTRMQSLEARTEYKNSVDCTISIARKEGVLVFWAGALPRLGRLTLSGGIVFTIYEKTLDLMEKFDSRSQYL
ncbi:uncharacterized protein Z520_10056 [Fonsecaea multimorphosa CBS 102226]|uniref:Uncharacterized protein n=1 Tax=Fonsecaea multimorphosa CBS 102226 TaxID=1442371 RepID=A0A0D2IB18_9EURO|nr:uncharacterized protein Z520_10056 [Fonsecaea multimorphosa CBS 102226]KIX94346.1 hypothetical protein Z520_10056 [Fonsecaea multimorphosa CBS 102226]OAL19678.1 hypothetical protein AYO22_09550 [Fonsecaea multimorphosa]